ncbi:unnamed protein product [[Candida] boidinii]|nr:unnamed protein product [[Candida] boidinii]
MTCEGDEGVPDVNALLDCESEFALLKVVFVGVKEEVDIFDAEPKVDTDLKLEADGVSNPVLVVFESEFTI